MIYFTVVQSSHRCAVVNCYLVSELFWCIKVIITLFLYGFYMFSMCLAVISHLLTTWKVQTSSLNHRLSSGAGLNSFFTLWIYQSQRTHFTVFTLSFMNSEITKLNYLLIPLNQWKRMPVMSCVLTPCVSSIKRDSRISVKILFILWQADGEKTKTIFLAWIRH